MAVKSYYKFPLELGKIMEGKDCPKIDLGTSISKNIELIVLTRFGEHRADTTFGCEIWELDFEHIVSEGFWEKKMCNSIQKSVTLNENRLANIEVIVTLSDIEKINAVYNYPEIRKKVEIRLKAVVKKTGEHFNFIANLFLSPLSVN